jgi:hypothetical protein
MAINAVTLLDGTTAYAHDVEDKVNPLYTDIDNSNIANGAGIVFSKMENIGEAELVLGNIGGVPTAVAMSGDVTIDSTGQTTLNGDLKGSIVPLGSIIPWYNYTGALEIALDTTYWHFCDGTAGVHFGDGNTRDLPDLSNRYLVGFGTEGGKDIGTAAWGASAVGNASHQVDISHTHAGAAHTHSLSHTHDVDIGSFNTGDESAHTHGAGSLQFAVCETRNGGAWAQIWFYDVSGTADLVVNNTGTSGGAQTGSGGTNDNATYYTKSGSGSTGAGSSHNHSVDPGNTTSSDASTTTTSGASATTTGTSGSTTQSIQPRSIPVRYIMRIK